MRNRRFVCSQICHPLIRRLQSIKCELADSIYLRRARQIFAGVTNALYQAVVAVDLEGTVAKKLGDPYNPKARWHKILIATTRSVLDAPNCSASVKDAMPGADGEVANCARSSGTNQS